MLTAPEDASVAARVQEEVRALAAAFPLYPAPRPPTGSAPPGAGVVPDGPGHHTAPAARPGGGHRRSPAPSLSTARVRDASQTASPGASAAVPELAFRDGIMDRIRMREQRFDERAYLFVLGALEYLPAAAAGAAPHLRARARARLPRSRARALRRAWRASSSSTGASTHRRDIGDIVFTLVELELLMSQPTDSRDEFAEVFDFDQAFERDYPWCAQFV